MPASLHGVEPPLHLCPHCRVVSNQAPQMPCCGLHHADASLLLHQRCQPAAGPSPPQAHHEVLLGRVLPPPALLHAGIEDPVVLQDHLQRCARLAVLHHSRCNGVVCKGRHRAHYFGYPVGVLHVQRLIPLFTACHPALQGLLEGRGEQHWAFGRSNDVADARPHKQARAHDWLHDHRGLLHPLLEDAQRLLWHDALQRSLPVLHVRAREGVRHVAQIVVVAEPLLRCAPPKRSMRHHCAFTAAPRQVRVHESGPAAALQALSQDPAIVALPERAVEVEHPLPRKPRAAVGFVNEERPGQLRHSGGPAGPSHMGKDPVQPSSRKPQAALLHLGGSKAPPGPDLGPPQQVSHNL
mmetsp:Transcript_87200/g.270928  ORF Transcript_87200/g.270928 Transcript_87200/m.270928 type:complete len:353 (-) Transcript_87200:1354-2412(-)